MHFTYRAHGFVIRGVLYGPRGKPKFKGTVEVVRRGCDGDVLTWTAGLVLLIRAREALPAVRI